MSKVSIQGWSFPEYDQGSLTRAYQYLDEKLWEFYQWFEENEAKRGTILIMVGDHGGLISRAYAYRAGHRVDTVVPLIIGNIMFLESNLSYVSLTGYTSSNGFLLVMVSPVPERLREAV